MSAASLPSTTAIGVALSRARLHSIGISWLLLLCLACGVCCFAPSALAQNAAPAAADGFGSDTGFTYQVPGIGPKITGSKAHDTASTSSPPQPDVEALDVTWSPPNPQTGDLVKFSALVTNLGNAPVPEYTVEFYLKNETGEISYFASYWDPQPLNPGETRWVTGGSNWNWGFWTATPGSHIALVVINNSYESLTKMLYVPSAPLASLTATGGDGQIGLTWTAVPGATSYNLYRSAAPGGEGGTPYKTGLTATSYVDAPLPSGTTYYYTFTAIGAQGESPQSNEAGATVQSFGPGRVRFYPRAGFEGRMLGGKFQGSNDGASYTDLATITATPSASQYTQQALSADPKTFHYLRYLSPSGGYCDLAELEFYSGTSAAKLTGIIFGTPGTSGNDCTHVFDGNPGTFFDASVADGAYVGLRQASPFTLTATAGTSQISLSWTSVAGASGYNVRRGTVSGGPYVVIAPGCTGTSYADTTALVGVPYFYIVTALSSGGESDYTNEAIGKIGSVLAPYGNSPVTVSADGATTVEAENYDLGGEGIAYHDVDNGGQTAYRSDNIGVAPDGNASNGFTVGWADGGEWDGYWLNVAKAGAYAVTTTFASPSSGGTFHLEFGPVGQVGGAGVVQTPEMTVPSTGGWASYDLATLPAVNLPAGPVWMRLVLEYGGNGHSVANFDSFTINPSATSKELRPYGGSPVLVAASGKTTVEAENYDLGGEGVAYHDVDNGGLADYRSDNIGVYVDGSASGGHAVGYAQQAEWEGYTLNVTAAGAYALTAHLANPPGGGTFHLEFGPVGQVGGAGVTRSGEFTVPNTGSWGNYQDVAMPAVNLPAGPLWMRVVLDSGSTGCGPYLANFDCFSLTPSVLVPTNLTAVAGSGQIILAWNASGGAASYNLYRSTTAGGEGTTPYKTGLYGTSYADTGVVASTPYYYTVTAVNAGGESAPSNEANATTGTSALPAPTGLTATAVSSTEIDLSWTAVVGATSYNLYRGITPGGEGNTPYKSGINKATYSDVGLTNGTTYYYFVTALSGGVEGDPSEEVYATPKPTVLSLVLSPSSIVGSYSSVGTLTLSAAAPAGGVVVILSSDNAVATAPTNITVPAGQSSITFEVKTTYVTASVIANISAVSVGSPQSASLTVTAYSYYMNNAAFVSQMVPTSVTAGRSYPVTVTMWNTGNNGWTPDTYSLNSWNLPENITWGLSRVSLPTSTTSIYSSVYPDGQKTIPFRITAPLTPGTYHFQWRMQQDTRGAFGQSTPDILITVNPAGGNPVTIPCPTNLIAVAVSGSEIDLSWQPTTGTISGYLIERRLDGTDEWSELTTTSSTSYADTGLQAGTVYQYRVSTMAGSVQSGYIAASATTLPAPPSVPTTLTQSQAIQIAQTFCQAIGQPVTATGMAEFPGAPGQGRNTYWLPRWLVTFPNQAVVEVVDATGTISRYNNKTYWIQMPNDPSRQAGALLSQADALQKANIALQATGQSEQLGPLEADLQQLNPDVQSFAWSLSWPRQLQRIPYRSQGAFVTMDAETGSIAALSLTYQSPPPVSTAVSVSQSQAEGVAQGQIANAGIQGATLGTSHLEIVQPNTLWQDGNENAQTNALSKVAWVVPFTTGSQDSSGPTYEVWIDTSNGSILGGAYSGGDRKIPTVNKFHKKLTTHKRAIHSRKTTASQNQAKRLKQNKNSDKER